MQTNAATYCLKMNRTGERINLHIGLFKEEQTQELNFSRYMMAAVDGSQFNADTVPIFCKTSFDLLGKPAQLYYQRSAFNDSQHLIFISFLSHHGVKAVEINTTVGEHGDH